ncbi:MAG: response regulator [Nitrospirota bacterium]
MVAECCAPDVQFDGIAGGAAVTPSCHVGRILIAEDVEQVRQFMTELLHRAGYRCDCVGTAREALQALATRAYDLLITDIHMPDNNSLTYLQACQGGAPPVPVIVITSYPSVGTAVEAVRLSVVDYLIKPVEGAALIESVGRAVGKGRILRSLRKVREEIRIWDEAMDRLEKSLIASESPDAGTRDAWQTGSVLERTRLLFGQIAASLKIVLETAKPEWPGQRNVDVCALVRCSKVAEYEAALRRTVEVLVQTKSAFKSKDLGDLRKTLTGLLKKEANEAPQVSQC